jgi:hypothetical protein
VHNVWTGVYVSRDGGRTWADGLIPGYPGDEKNASLPLHHYPCASDPVLAFSSNGTLYYVSLPYTPCPADQQPATPLLEPVSSCAIDSGLVLSRSRDGGATWDLQVEVARRYGSAVLDKQWLACDPATGQLYLSYIDSATGAIEVQRSDDEGATWSHPVPVVQPGSFPQGPVADQYAQVAVGPGSVVHVTYYTLGQASNLPEAIWHRASRDHGATWDGPSHVADVDLPLDLGVEHKYRMVGMPSLAVDAQTADVYVAYPTRDPVDSDVFVASSHDEGRSWGNVLVNDDFAGVPGAASVPTTPLNEQWMPAIAVGPDHTIHVTWVDSRDDPTGQSASIYYAHSATLGADFSRNAKLSDVPFDGTGGYHQSGSGTIGDYMGLVATRDGVHAVWADTRNQRNDLFSAFLPG